MYKTDISKNINLEINLITVIGHALKQRHF